MKLILCTLSLLIAASFAVDCANMVGQGAGTPTTLSAAATCPTHPLSHLSSSHPSLAALTAEALRPRLVQATHERH